MLQFQTIKKSFVFFEPNYNCLLFSDTWNNFCQTIIWSKYTDTVRFDSSYCKLEITDNCKPKKITIQIKNFQNSNFIGKLSLTSLFFFLLVSGEV